MIEKTLLLIETFNSEVEDLKRKLDAINDDDMVGINVCFSLIAEKKHTIQRLKSISGM